MLNVKLDARLEAAARLVGEGTVADIGSDHALLPIELVRRGTPRALASDINEGPCERARIHVRAAGLTDKITVKCCPGLDGIEEFAPDNIIIAGMGGELIASILGASDYPEKSECRLILQPMTMHGELRRFLADGYRITHETVVREGGKHYQLMAAVWDGERRTFTDAELRLGALNLARAAESPTDADRTWLEFIRKGALTRIRGREIAGITDEAQTADRELLDLVNKLLQGV